MGPGLMRTILSVLVAGALVGAAHAQTASQMPQYSAETVVSYASLAEGPLAPNSLVTIFGRNLAWVTQFRSEWDVAGDTLPLILPGTSVMVMVDGLAAPVDMVSPEQVTFLMPPNLGAGTAEIRLVHAGRAGPAVRVQVKEYAPALYLWNHGVALARHPETHEWVEPELPAEPGQEVILYATGLGETDPPLEYRQIPREERQIKAWREFVVWFNDEPLPEDRLGYVGVMPGFPGIYEIHVRLPDELPSNPQVRLQIGETVSPEQIRLAVKGFDDPEPAPEGEGG